MNLLIKFNHYNFFFPRNSRLQSHVTNAEKKLYRWKKCVTDSVLHRILGSAHKRYLYWRISTIHELSLNIIKILYILLHLIIHTKYFFHCVDFHKWIISVDDFFRNFSHGDVSRLSLSLIVFSEWSASVVWMNLMIGRYWDCEQIADIFHSVHVKRPLYYESHILTSVNIIIQPYSS